MFQNFSGKKQKDHSSDRISRLRRALADIQVEGLIVPRGDEFQGEYVPASSERLTWLTGFSGSAGTAVILQKTGAIFVDGRYTLQVREQVETDILVPHQVPDQKPEQWIAANLASGSSLGFDPWLITIAEAEKYRKACQVVGGKLIALKTNPVDVIWSDRPQRPSAQIQLQPLQFAGIPASSKMADIAKGLKQRRSNACVLTQTDAVAWAFNIRGQDIPHTPAVLAFAVVHDDATAELYIDPARAPEDVRDALKQANVSLISPDGFDGGLKKLGAAGAAVELDPDWAADALRQLLEDAGAKITHHDSPCTIPRATKNSAELEGSRAAHLRDGVPMVRFLRWLNDNAQTGELDEITAAKKLEALRTATGELRDISFDSISGAGPHAAIPHYRVSETSNLPIKRDQIYLIDSGAQYVDGTTDITRTIIVGTPAAEIKDRFTRVLKGMINLSRIRFPAGTTGGHLDVLARAALWEAGLDFDHGTGHGVGSYLSVHEGPQRFSKTDKTVLLPGMILSNEPGYYKAGDYGIRIENLLAVREAEPIKGGERPMHWFETLSFTPIDKNLIDPSIMTDAELEWLDQYHAQVLKKIGPRLDDPADTEWLKTACAPITR